MTTERTYTQSEWDAREREWQAKVAAAYQAAADWLRRRQGDEGYIDDTADLLVDGVRTLTPADAATALEAIVKERVEKAVATLRAELEEMDSSPCGVSGHRLVDWVTQRESSITVEYGDPARATILTDPCTFTPHCLRCDEVKAAYERGLSDGINKVHKDEERWAR